MRVGPSPARARRRASTTEAYTAWTSVPSTTTPGKPYATAFSARVSECVWRSLGREIAHWLFWQKNIVGVLYTPAKLSPAWKSLELVVPSPKKVIVTMGSLRRWIAIAAPTAWVIWVPTGLEAVTKL